ncbi:Uncharacterised protein [Mycobacteroides abscessus subsp. abscessus]|nr:Uncharacterised protein [Mycobacteroides abscessus subsp. abscessus]SHV76896.1 Uncharacterised protein [Mycobacteroides abscessus subsp. abscessus]SHY52804.1 Uncharacterised protein [Mycobacteroides abscessus subsp. abscessus]SHZ43317.1 Uncharacterised protein [Mycobacteroides abscessus subsp. abscessus]SHZ67713.1 Uncharacterised protein [Mycobacteroides abscessus subsp. abscessus]
MSSASAAPLEWVVVECWPGPPREASYQGGRYQIYPWKGGWTFNRTDHPLLPKFDGWAATECEAMMLCQNDYQKVARLIAWVEYILNNDPPSP